MKLYKLGYYINGDTSKKLYHSELLAMTHKQALTMKSKQRDPSNCFLYEVSADSETL